MLVTTIQCAARIDAITDDGEPLYQQPYPYHLSPDGDVLQQSLWRGKLSKLVGFQKHSEIQRVDLFWFQIVPEGGRPKLVTIEDFDQVRGMYPVFVDDKGSMFSFDTPVDTVRQWEAAEDNAILAEPGDEDA